MPNVVFPRDGVLRSTLGFAIHYVAGAPVAIPEVLLRAAIQAGAAHVVAALDADKDGSVVDDIVDAAVEVGRTITKSKGRPRKTKPVDVEESNFLGVDV
jgi:hypothetical protein